MRQESSYGTDLPRKIIKGEAGDNTPVTTWTESPRIGEALRLAGKTSETESRK